MLDAAIITPQRFSSSFHTVQTKAYLYVRDVFFLISQLLLEVRVSIILA